ncbi:HAMP domain-containing sensor histidine kinase [Shewanella sp. FJAT-52076]|uniref:sensor histidine kinase n=1 Tax=Shewanella sp. FJAT-52076 TaxID=2864202 RepID=UPI001C65C835|nr:HAMP domain-containing sensor histidine kinase [Shewanella sp. FJAT-52076]QYJ77311.1 HAMP domain-containing histidine kinase [Shewanella sp. FJAT-52076]
MTLITGALLFTLYRQLVTEQQYQIEQHLETEKQRYIQLAQSVDRRSFAAQIRAADPKSVLVAWRNSFDIVGSLSLMPEDIPLLPETVEFPILTGGPDKLHILTGGLVITRYGPVLIATRTDQLATLIKKFLRAAVTTMTLTIVLTMALGYLFSKAILRRLVQYNRLAQRIERGHYDTRLPVSWRQDEFDMLARQFNRVLDTLEANLQAVRGVTDNIAHDLRTPLSHLRIGLEQLRDKPQEERAEKAEQLIEELDFCLATFDAMLSLTRIEEGQQQLDLQQLSLSALCADLVEMAELLAEERGQTLSLELGRECTLQGDKHLLFQALFNLVDNAIKYAGDGAAIRISQNGREVVIADNGPGIPPESRERVFERLVRLDPSRHHQGTGLGLSMVKAILSRHQAHIRLEDNQPGLRAVIEFQ